MKQLNVGTLVICDVDEVSLANQRTLDIQWWQVLDGDELSLNVFPRFGTKVFLILDNHVIDNMYVKSYLTNRGVLCLMSTDNSCTIIEP